CCIWHLLQRKKRKADLTALPQSDDREVTDSPSQELVHVEQVISTPMEIFKSGDNNGNNSDANSRAIYRRVSQSQEDDPSLNETVDDSNEEIAARIRHFAVAPVFAKYEDPNGRKALLHLDIKSSNIALDLSLNARLIDFGLAREIEGDDGIKCTGDKFDSKWKGEADALSGEEIAKKCISSWSSQRNEVFTFEDVYKSLEELESVRGNYKDELPVERGNYKNELPVDKCDMCLINKGAILRKRKCILDEKSKEDDCQICCTGQKLREIVELSHEIKNKVKNEVMDIRQRINQAQHSKKYIAFIGQLVSVYKDELDKFENRLRVMSSFRIIKNKNSDILMMNGEDFCSNPFILGSDGEDSSLADIARYLRWTEIPRKIDIFLYIPRGNIDFVCLEMVRKDTMDKQDYVFYGDVSKTCRTFALHRDS
ncbi:hypothetical protein MAR_030679, partial [Mya arenaria]